MCNTLAQAHPHPVSEANLRARMPNINLGLDKKIGSDLLAWLRRCHGALVVVDGVDGGMTLTAHGELTFLKVGEESAAIKEEQRAANETRSDLAIAQRNAVFGELQAEAHKRAAGAVSDDIDDAN